MDNGRGPDLQDRNPGAERDSCAAQLPSRQAWDFHLAGGRRAPVADGAAESKRSADTCVSAAHPIITELLAQLAGVPKRRA